MGSSFLHRSGLLVLVCSHDTVMCAQCDSALVKYARRAWERCHLEGSIFDKGTDTPDHDRPWLLDMLVTVWMVPFRFGLE